MNPPLRAVVAAEFLGTALLCLLGNGVVASAFLLDKDPRWLLITTGWALGVTLGVFVSGRTSGGHLNPAVTLALAVRGELAWHRLPAYWGAQLAGAIAGALLVYADYAAAFAAFEAKNHLTRGALAGGKLVGPAAGGAGIFATFPEFDGLGGNLLSEFLGTAVLVFAVRALSNPRNDPPKSNTGPLFVGAVVWAIGMSLGGLTGYAINPARDLGPRIAAAVLGWGSSVFVSHGYYFWVPIVAPLAGGVAGALLFDLAVARTLPPEVEPNPPGRLSP
jgi:glycerol uptake facilitator protein